MIVLRYLYFIYSALIFIVLLLFGVPYYIIVGFLFKDKAQKYRIAYNRWWSNTWAFLSFVRCKSYGEENYDADKEYVLVCNHTSMGDVIILMDAIRKIAFVPLAKMELRKVPVLGYLFSKAAVLVDRKDPDSRSKSVAKLKELGKKNISVMLFPEGTRNKKPENPLKEFHTGAFRIAIDLQRPVLPMVVIGARDLLPGETFPHQPCKIYAHIGKPIPTEGLTQEDAYDLKQRVYDVMEQLLIENDPRYEGYLRARDSSDSLAK